MRMMNRAVPVIQRSAEWGFWTAKHTKGMETKNAKGFGALRGLSRSKLPVTDSAEKEVR
jgi:hypothetical protein